MASDKRPPLTMLCTECKVHIYVTNKNKTICGYSATSKSTTIYNYCGISTEYIKFITDTTPIKQNKLSNLSLVLFILNLKKIIFRIFKIA